MITGITSIYIGSDNVQKAYIGTSLVYSGGTQPIDYSTKYFTTRSLADNNTLTFTINSSVTTTYATYISYSTDNGATWNTTDVDGTEQAITVSSLNSGDTVLWKGSAQSWAKPATSSVQRYASKFSATYDYEVEGNIMSLLYSDNFRNNVTLPGNNSFVCIFSGSTTLVNAENLVLPATTLTDYCYRSMFSGCTSLETAPELPATTLANSCYHTMFSGCTSLETAPELPATTLAENCYTSMFARCTSLTTAPELPATTLYNYCYSSIFKGCTSLTAAPVLPATTMADNCYKNMFDGCRSLTTAPELPATTLASSCYFDMFSGCTSLTTAPVLPATTLVYACYDYMFAGCTSLTTAPVLPATTLAESCYNGMFRECTSLTTVPELPATALAQRCYFQMFYGCSSLNYIKCLATDISASQCTYTWVDGVSATGTFVKDASMTGWTTGIDGIPSGWTVQSA